MARFLGPNHRNSHRNRHRNSHGTVYGTLYGTSGSMRQKDHVRPRLPLNSVKQLGTRLAIFVIAFVWFLLPMVAQAALQCETVFSKSTSLNRNFLVSSTIFSPVVVDQSGVAKMQTGQVLNGREVLGPKAEPWTHRLGNAPRAPDMNDDIGFLYSPIDFELWSYQANLAEALSFLYRGYGTRLTEVEKQFVKNVDYQSVIAMADLQRAGYIVIRSSQNIAAMARVYDGTDHSHQTQSSYYGSHLHSNPSLPSESILKEKNIKTEVFSDLRKNGFQIFELGKYFIGEDNSPIEKLQIKKSIFNWVLRNYLFGDDAALAKIRFVIDVSNPVHERAYRSLYGAKSLDENLFDPPLKSPDFIMLVDGATLKSHLEHELARIPE